jgi:hypothetical protein
MARALGASFQKIRGFKAHADDNAVTVKQVLKRFGTRDTNTDVTVVLATDDPVQVRGRSRTV